MDDSTKQIGIVCATILIFLVVLTITLGVQRYKVQDSAFRNGYEEASIQGCHGSYWVKSKSK